MTTIPPLLVLVLVPVAAPAGAGPKEEPIKIVVLVILGTDQNNDINAHLKEIAPQLQKKDKTLTGFELKKTIDHALSMGESKQMELVGDAKLTVTINDKTDDAGRATITIKPPKLDEITYACTCGKFFPILTNYYTADNKRLIIAVMATPCKNKKK